MRRLLLLAGLLVLAGCGGSMDKKPVAVARSYEPSGPAARTRYGYLVIKNTTSRQVACLVDIYGLSNVQAGSDLRLQATPAYSIGDMFGVSSTIDWVNCGGDPGHPGFPGGTLISGLDLSISDPNITVVYAGDRFYKES